MKRRSAQTAIMALCGTAAASSSVQRKVWVQSRSQERWDGDVSGFGETDFSHTSRPTFNQNVCFRL